MLKIKFAVVNWDGQGGPLGKGHLSKDAKAVREQATQNLGKAFQTKQAACAKALLFGKVLHDCGKASKGKW